MPLGEGSRGGFTVVDVDELVSEVGSEPGKGSTSDIEGGLDAGEEDGVVDGVEGCGEVKEDEDINSRQLLACYQFEEADRSNGSKT